MSIDGFVAGPEGQLDWMTWDWDDQLNAFVTELTDSIDTILMGRKMTAEFISYWESALKNPADPSHAFAHKMVNTPKIVFSRSQKTITGINTSITNDDVVEVVNKLKAQPGKDMVVYGGAGFVSSLIEHNLIDELNLLINPTAIVEGLSIFKKNTKLQLLKSIRYDCGINLLQYKSVQQ
jgi:dihydrofolate reductase